MVVLDPFSFWCALRRDGNAAHARYGQAISRHFLHDSVN